MAPAFPLASKQPEFLASGAILFFSSRAYQSSKLHALEADSRFVMTMFAFERVER
jgi:hypothetical protein